jgi:ParB family chromosome partitioning protein
MVEQRRGLGRGLSALLEEANEATADAGSVAGGRAVPIELIRRNPDQPRRHFAEEEIETLAASIREKGVLQPILVRPAPGATGEYQIVAGERRWRAAQAAGLREVPVLIRELDDAETLEIAILENVQRTDLNAIEEAAGYRMLMDRFDRTQETVSKAVGKSRSHVANSVRLLALPEEIQRHVIAGRLTAGHARALSTAEDPAGLAARIIAEDLNVRQTEALAKTAGGKPRAAKTPAGKDVDTLDLEKRVSEALGLKVDIRDSGGHGEIRVSYKSLEQLELVCRRLSAHVR